MEVRESENIGNIYIINFVVLDALTIEMIWKWEIEQKIFFLWFKKGEDEIVVLFQNSKNSKMHVNV